MKRAVRPVLVAVAVAGFAAGCGGGSDTLSKPEYERELAAALPPLGKKLDTQTLAIARARTRRVARQHVAILQKALRDGAARIERIEAPEDAAGAHDELARGFRLLANEVATVAKPGSSRAYPFARFERAVTRTTGFELIRQAVAELQRRGYRLARTR